MNVLVACEESQAVCKAFRERGHNAFSCDIQECSGGHPEWHIKGDALRILEPQIDCKGLAIISFKTQNGSFHALPGWELIIAHPPCTYLTNAGARWLWAGHELNQERYQKGLAGKDFFMQFWNADCPRVAIENPIPSAVFDMPEYTQVIQPYEYGHPYSKKTCLWLRGLPPLKPTDVVEDHLPYVTSGSYSKGHDPKYKGASRAGGAAKMRSKTFPGIAAAMAEQWGGLCDNAEDWLL